MKLKLLFMCCLTHSNAGLFRSNFQGLFLAGKYNFNSNEFKGACDVSAETHYESHGCGGYKAGANAISYNDGIKLDGIFIEYSSMWCVFDYNATMFFHAGIFIGLYNLNKNSGSEIWNQVKNLKNPETFSTGVSASFTYNLRKNMDFFVVFKSYMLQKHELVFGIRLH